MADSLVLRRARTQWPVLLAVLALVVAGTTLLGTCTLLLTTGQQQALASAARAATPADVQVTASLILAPPEAGAPQHGAESVAAARDVLTGALDPFASEVSTWVTSAMRYLPPASHGTPRLAYLLDADTLSEHATLDTGRWPTPGAAAEVAVPSSTADLLGLATGSRLLLAATPQHDVPDDDDAPDDAAADDAAADGTVVVVGTFTPQLDGAGTWRRDPLRGAGFDPSWGRLTAYGPFVVAPGALLGAPTTLDRVSLEVHPDLASSSTSSTTSSSPSSSPSSSTAAALGRVAAAVRTSRAELTATLGERASSIVIRSALPTTVATAATQQGLTRSAVLVVALVGWALAGTALGLAGRLLHGRRAAEVTLLTARGAHRGRLVRQAVAESLVLALLAAVLAIPLSAALYQRLAAMPLLAAAGLGGPAPLTVALLITVTGGAVTLVAVLVGPSLRGSPDGHGRGDRPSRRGLLARSGADLVLAAVAVLAFLQLRAHRGATGPDPDPVLVLAPVVCLLAGAVLALRVLPWLAALGEGHARRSTRLALPLAAWEAARRPQATAGAFLLVLATAAATFGVSWSSTWMTSQQDQADAQVGTDLRVDLTGTAPLVQGPTLAAATGGTVAPVTDRAIGLGSRAAAGAGGSTRLIAVDTLRSAELMRGRLPADASWSELSALLAPEQPLSGPVVGRSGTVRLAVSGAAVASGSSGPDETLLRVTPTVVAVDAWGSRSATTGPSVPLDGRTHQLDLAVADGTGALPEDLTVVAVGLRVALDPEAAVSRDVDRSAAVTVELELPDRDPSTVHSWVASPTAGLGPRLSNATAGPTGTQAATDTQVATETGTGDRTVVTMTADVSLLGLLDADAQVMLTTFAPPPELPVTVSADLASALALTAGDPLTLTLDGTAVEAHVVAVAPYLPSVPRGPAVLADRDALTRMLLVQGDLDPLTDAWWVGDVVASATAAGTLAGLTTAEPTTRVGLGEQLQGGALRVLLRVALWVLVGAALLLAVAGTAVHTAAVQEGRAVEVARLQGLGVPRRTVLRSLLLQHGTVTVVAVVAGAALGGLLSWAVGPLLVVSGAGLPPVPAAVPRWPWDREIAVIVGLVLVCAAVALPVLASLVRRATVAHLRMDVEQ